MGYSKLDHLPCYLNMVSSHCAECSGRTDKNSDTPGTLAWGHRAIVHSSLTDGSQNFKALISCLLALGGCQDAGRGAGDGGAGPGLHHWD